jgi:o-succinylbenzoate synthase
MKRFSASFRRYPLIFKKPAGTSRGYLLEKPCWFLTILDLKTGIEGVGECSIIPGLSIDNEDSYESKLEEICALITSTGNIPELDLENYPSIRFGIEMALLDLEHGGKGIFFESPFTKGKRGIPINGLVWMGSIEEMWEQIPPKVESGYKVIKIKIGSIDFDNEIRLIAKIRQHYPDISLRLDANGAFSPEEAFKKLETQSAFNIHSIEQPIKQGQWEEMAKLCKQSPIPIALDEELIGIRDHVQKQKLLDTIMPQFIILKPSLLGGFGAADEWIKLAEERNIGWWATSALESNIGLNAIAQWTAKKLGAYLLNGKVLAQGLGTGSLYKNNVESSLHIRNGELWL